MCQIFFLVEERSEALAGIPASPSLGAGAKACAPAYITTFARILHMYFKVLVLAFSDFFVALA